ncbi:hypothetical protein DIPPA_50883 [Diplonema papillatum]|nr:hypothetical protein DIPPA_50883 [Diplonema papillatum]
MKTKRKLKNHEASDSTPKTTVQSIYHPYNPAETRAKKNLKWADLSKKKKGNLQKVHTYSAPWAANKDNWWQRSGFENCLCYWNVKLNPGEKTKMDLARCLRQELHITTVSAAYMLEGAGNVLLKSFHRPANGSLNDVTSTDTLIAALIGGQVRDVAIDLPSGQYVIVNTGNIPVSLHGYLETMNFRMK